MCTELWIEIRTLFSDFAMAIVRFDKLSPPSTNYILRSITAKSTTPSNIFSYYASTAHDIDICSRSALYIYIFFSRPLHALHAYALLTCVFQLVSLARHIFIPFSWLRSWLLQSITKSNKFPSYFKRLYQIELRQLLCVCFVLRCVSPNTI